MRKTIAKYRCMYGWTHWLPWGACKEFPAKLVLAHRNWGRKTATRVLCSRRLVKKSMTLSALPIRSVSNSNLGIPCFLYRFSWKFCRVMVVRGSVISYRVRKKILHSTEIFSKYRRNIPLKYSNVKKNLKTDKNIVEMVHQFCYVHSENDVGSVFFFYLNNIAK